ncbi:MAG: DUF1573 domain-containing protein [Bacteroidales bacterium]|nr:DUF1573 domain-containing protein [Bacteroidales bacterium]
MKQIGVLAFTILLFLGACQSSDKTQVDTDLIQNPLTAEGDIDTTTLPKFQWKEMVHDFGVIVQGERVSYTFTFKNVGKSNLIISSVHASCGCTVPKYDSAPIAPGKEGKIEVVFDSSGRSGMQNKTVTVLANTQPSAVELHFTAEVVVPENR